MFDSTCSRWADHVRRPRSRATAALHVLFLSFFHQSFTFFSLESTTPPPEAGEPLAAVLTFLTVMPSSTERRKKPLVLLTSALLVHLIPVMYLALPSRSPVNRQAGTGSVRTKVLTTPMNFSWGAQGGRSPSGLAGEVKPLSDGSYRRCPPPPTPLAPPPAGCTGVCEPLKQ